MPDCCAGCPVRDDLYQQALDAEEHWLVDFAGEEHHPAAWDARHRWKLVREHDCAEGCR